MTPTIKPRARHFPETRYVAVQGLRCYSRHSMPARTPFMKLALCVTAAALAGAANAQVITPAAPRYLEPVYLRHGPNPYEYWQSATPSMEGGVLVVRIRSVSCSDLCLPIDAADDIFLGRFPTGTYAVQIIVNDSPVIPGQFTVAAPANPQRVDYSGMWWLPSESGWGLSISQGPTGLLFAVLFAYGPTGEPTWYTLQTESSANASSFTGTVYKTSGPYYGGAFDPTRVTVTRAGSGSLRFARMDVGTLVFDIDGVILTKQITRQVIE